MAKRVTQKKAKKSIAYPSSITLRLFDPGMSIMHRAGLGGLACTLRYIEDAYKDGGLTDDEAPGGPWTNGIPPWAIDPLHMTLDFGQPEHAQEFMKRLFTLAFQIKDGMIYLPGQHCQPASAETLAVFQNALMLTFLQHNKARGLSKENTTITYEIDGHPLSITTRTCDFYKHQQGWNDLCTEEGFGGKSVKIPGTLQPGAIVRHNAFSTPTSMEESCEHALALFFSIVGCLALTIGNGGRGSLIVPEVDNLEMFSIIRPLLTPTSIRECRVAGTGDAALQAQLRLKSKNLASDLESPACHAITFESTPWASQQKTRTDLLPVPSSAEIQLDTFEKALAELPPRIVSRTVEKTAGKGKNKTIHEETECFWVDSIVRPFIADNLATGRRWYEGFVNLMIKTDPVRKKPYRDQVFFEKKGLNAMMNGIEWQDRGEQTVVKAVHEAIRRRYGIIAQENQGNPVAMKKRWGGEFDRWRLSFAGAKTSNQFRHALCDLFSRAGLIPTLQSDWKTLLPMLDDRQWELTRDLSLLALASYSREGSKEIEEEKLEESGLETDEEGDSQ